MIPAPMMRTSVLVSIVIGRSSANHQHVAAYRRSPATAFSHPPERGWNARKTIEGSINHVCQSQNVKDGEPSYFLNLRRILREGSFKDDCSDIRIFLEKFGSGMLQLGS